MVLHTLNILHSALQSAPGAGQYSLMAVNPGDTGMTAAPANSRTVSLSVEGGVMMS